MKFVIALFLLGLPSIALAEQCMNYDVSHDQKVTARDALIVLRAAVGFCERPVNPYICEGCDNHAIALSDGTTIECINGEVLQLQCVADE